MWKELLGEHFVAHYTLDDGQVLVLSFVDDEIMHIVPMHVKKKDKLLVVTEKEITDGADVFPIEWLSIQTAGACAEGKDILKNIKITPKDLREQLEYELRSKLIDLRQHMFFERSERNIATYLHSGIGTVVPMLRALIVLKGKSPNGGLASLAAQVESLWEVDSKVIVKASTVSPKAALLCAKELRHWFKQIANVVNDVVIE